MTPQWLSVLGAVWRPARRRTGSDACDVGCAERCHGRSAPPPADVLCMASLPEVLHRATGDQCASTRSRDGSCTQDGFIDRDRARRDRPLASCSRRRRQACFVPVEGISPELRRRRDPVSAVPAPGDAGVPARLVPASPMVRGAGDIRTTLARIGRAQWRERKMPSSCAVSFRWDGGASLTVAVASADPVRPDRRRDKITINAGPEDAAATLITRFKSPCRRSRPTEVTALRLLATPAVPSHCGIGEAAARRAAAGRCARRRHVQVAPSRHRGGPSSAQPMSVTGRRRDLPTAAPVRALC